jgi:hypothetical protein
MMLIGRNGALGLRDPRDAEPVGHLLDGAEETSALRVGG